MDGYLAELQGVKSGLAPQELNGSAKESARFDMGKAGRCACVIEVAAAAADLVVNLKQHDAASGGTSKVVAVKHNYYVKLIGADSFTKTELSAEASTLTLSEFNAAGGVLIVEVHEDDLDVNGDFSHVSFEIGDPGAARLGAAMLHGLKSDKVPAYSEEY